MEAAACTRPLCGVQTRSSSRAARHNRPVVAAASAGGERRVAIQEPRELDGLDSALAGLSTNAMYGAAAALVAVGLGTGAALAGAVARACPPPARQTAACGSLGRARLQIRGCGREQPP